MTALKGGTADAKAVYVGTTPAKKVYLGSTLIWSSGFDPRSISGLKLWLDPAQGMTDASGAGNHPTVVGSPTPAVVTESTANSQKVFRFNLNEGRVRNSTFPVSTNFTTVHVARVRTSNIGRGLCAIYPGPQSSNFLVGMHSSSYDAMYDDGWLAQPPLPSSYPTPWKMYSADGTTGTSERFFVNGSFAGSKAAPSHGFGLTYAISGYDATLTPESCDIDVGEVLIYDHQLTDAERQQVENYLRVKYLRPPSTGAYSAAVMNDNPKAYWRLGETSGTAMADSSGNGRHGLYFAAKAGAPPGLLSAEVDLGSNQTSYCQGVAGGWMDQMTTISVEALIKPSEAGQTNRGIVTRYDAAQCFILWMNTSGQIAWRPYSRTGGSTDVAWTGTPTVGSTYHVVATYTSGRARLYINGSQVAQSTALTGGIQMGGVQSIEIGCYANNSWLYAGVRDEVAVYDYELSPAQIANHNSLR